MPLERAVKEPRSGSRFCCGKNTVDGKTSRQHEGHKVSLGWFFPMLHCCIHLCHLCQANRDSSKWRSVDIFNPIVLIFWSNRLKSNELYQISSNWKQVHQQLSKNSSKERVLLPSVSKHQFSELVNVNHTLPTQHARNFQPLWLPRGNGLPMFYNKCIILGF